MALDPGKQLATRGQVGPGLDFVRGRWREDPRLCPRAGRPLGAAAPWQPRGMGPFPHIILQDPSEGSPPQLSSIRGGGPEIRVVVSFVGHEGNRLKPSCAFTPALAHAVHLPVTPVAPPPPHSKKGAPGWCCLLMPADPPALSNPHACTRTHLAVAAHLLSAQGHRAEAEDTAAQCRAGLHSGGDQTCLTSQEGGWPGMG